MQVNLACLCMPQMSLFRYCGQILCQSTTHLPCCLNAQLLKTCIVYVTKGFLGGCSLETAIPSLAIVSSVVKSLYISEPDLKI